MKIFDWFRCYCLPPKTVLLGIGYLKLVVIVATIIQYIVFMSAKDPEIPPNRGSSVASMLSGMFRGAMSALAHQFRTMFRYLIIPHFIDLICTAIFVFASHKKIYRLLKIYLFYCIVGVLICSSIVILMLCSFFEYFRLYFMTFNFTWFTLNNLNLREEGSESAFVGLGITSVVLQIYVAFIIDRQIRGMKILDDDHSVVEDVCAIDREDVTANKLILDLDTCNYK